MVPEFKNQHVVKYFSANINLYPFKDTEIWVGVAANVWDMKLHWGFMEEYVFRGSSSRNYR